MTYLQRGRMGLWGVGALALVAACVMAIVLLGGGANREDGTELLLKVHLSGESQYNF